MLHSGKRVGIVAIHPSLVNLARSTGAIFGRRTGFAKHELRWHAPTYLLASAIVALASGDPLFAASHKQVTAQASKTSKAESKNRAVTEAKRLTAYRSKPSKAEHHKQQLVIDKRVERAPGPRTILATDGDLAPAPQLLPDLVTLKQAIQLVQQHKLGDATKLVASIEDPAAQKLLQWALLRDPDSRADFDQYNSFIQANPNWPSMPLLRRRAEARLWQERRDAATVRRFVGMQPTSAYGRLAMARLLLAEGDHADAARANRMAIGRVICRVGNHSDQCFPRSIDRCR